MFLCYYMFEYIPSPFQESDSRFTYCPKYNSATLVPVSVDGLRKLALEESKSSWKTKSGFIYPGMKSAVQSNHYPVQLHPARKQEIQLVDVIKV